MMRQRLYNPAQLTPEELKASFVAREDTLTDMLRLIREQTLGRPCQHMMLIGPRGMGKTTLGLRFLHEVRDTPILASNWQPVAFHEESYGVGSLADFWLAALNHLSRATEDDHWADRAEALQRDEGDAERLAAYALAALMDFCQRSGKRLILFVENLDAVFGQFHDERQVHALRASLIERPNILLIGSANAVFETIQSHGEPLYEFFRLIILEGLGPEDTRRILSALANSEDGAEVMETLNHEQGRLETIRRMTGGNPRLLVLACRMLIDSPLGPAFEDLERLIDEQTPYFKARIEELPIQARKVFHCLAEGWKPMLAREVADAAKLSSSHASAQLRQLMEKGYAREVTLPDAKRTLYEVNDRFYNIYYLLRFSRAGRDRLARLVAFLHDLFGPHGMRTMYPATLAALRMQELRAGETSDLLGILAEYVAKDEDFRGREDWLRQALDLAKDMIGPNAPVIGEIRDAFEDQHGSDLDRLVALMKRSVALSQAGRFEDAEAVCRAAIEERPNDTGTWTALGLTLMGGGRLEEAITAFDRVLYDASARDMLASRVVADAALAGKATSLFQLNRYAAVVTAVKWFEENLLPGHPANLLPMAAYLFRFCGRALAKLDRHEEAMAAWERVAECVCIDDPPDLRRTAAESLCDMGAALVKLDRYEEAIEAWERVAKYVGAGDPPDLRRTAAKALRATSAALGKLDEAEKSMQACERAAGYVSLDDPPDLRHIAATALSAKYATLLTLQRYDESNSVWRSASDYVRADDPQDLRQPVVGLLVTGGSLLNLLGRCGEAEQVCEKATAIDPAHYESWQVLADAILCQNDPGRLADAEDCARRAVRLAPDKAAPFHTLYRVLAGRGNWTEALGALERALRTGSEYANEHRPVLTVSLIQAVAAGHGAWVKRMMKDTGLIESMEPLWHAVRAELGEELEPLPAEIMDAVTDIRREFAGDPDSPSGVTQG